MRRVPTSSSLAAAPARVVVLLAGLVAAVLVAALRAGSPEAPARLVLEWPRTDFERHTVPLEEIVSGGPPRDGIPAIDRPRFVTVAEARGWLHPREPVAVLRTGSSARAYPLQILVWHEIVNDTVDGRPVLVTFCPLCHAVLAFERRVNGQVLDFGTTGRLRRSDLVMYDRQSESWWQQFTGSGIVGRHAGARLRQLPIQLMALADFAAAWPHGEVLSRDTGYQRPYGHNPYRGYDRIDSLPFALDGPPDPRLPPMERVLAVRVGGATRIYPFGVLAGAGVVNDRVGGVPVVVFAGGGTLSVLDAARITDSRQVGSATAFARTVGNRVLDFEPISGGFRDTQTASRWDLAGRALAGPLRGRRLVPLPGGVHFAFAWLAFHPDADIYAAGVPGATATSGRAPGALR